MNNRKHFLDLCIKLETEAERISNLKSTPPSRVFYGVLNSVARQVAVAARCGNLPVEVAAWTCRIVLEWKVTALAMINQEDKLIEFDAERWVREAELVDSVRALLPSKWECLGLDSDLCRDFIRDFNIDTGKASTDFSVRRHLRAAGMNRAEFNALYYLCSQYAHATGWLGGQGEECDDGRDPVRDAFLDEISILANDILAAITAYRIEYMPRAKAKAGRIKWAKIHPIYARIKARTLKKVRTAKNARTPKKARSLKKTRTLKR